MDQKRAVNKIKAEIENLNIPTDIVDIMDLYLTMAYAIGFNEGMDFMPRSKTVIQIDRYGDDIREFESCAHASRALGIDRGTIYKSASGNFRNKSAGGYKWKFKEINKL